MSDLNDQTRVLELRVLRAAALNYQAQTDVSAGREPKSVDGRHPGMYLREQVRELALDAGSIIHLLAAVDQEEHYLQAATDARPYVTRDAVNEGRPWCGAPSDLGGQQPCPVKTPCDAGTCRIGSAVGAEVYRPDTGSNPPGGEA